ncbi:hypothetical protein IOD16_17610 [Saccharothrix sp. 6-C]|uniref:hypothetical protein n=1 Tax=Saccharothrix sp. 6-C TaxID=2781735 RepID=UPI0019176CDA|nr:hypothetical protein [Saccharothrix sp. 6-C]QQQ80035.1 hypothetical protein IOD16_17610 [Saccharothrix sp. 6-C]
MEFDRDAASPPPPEPAVDPAREPAPAAPAGTSFGRSLLASLVWVGVVLVAAVVIAGAPPSGYGVGVVLGRLVLPTLVSAWLVRRFFGHKRLAFGWLVLASLPTFFVCFVVLGAILLAGQR